MKELLTKRFDKLLLMAALLLFTGCASFYCVPKPKEGGDYVVMIHGHWASGAYFIPLDRALQEKGYSTLRVNYPSTLEPIEALSENLFTKIDEKLTDPTKKVHFVTHSMGGIILRHRLEDHKIRNLGKVVMVSPPNQGSEVIDYYRSSDFCRWVIGPAGAQLGTEESDLPKSLGAAKFSPFIIAGTKSSYPTYSQLLPGPDDGKVSTASCAVRGMANLHTLPYTHDTILSKEETIDLIIRLIETE